MKVREVGVSTSVLGWFFTFADSRNLHYVNAAGSIDDDSITIVQTDNIYMMLGFIFAAYFFEICEFCKESTIMR